jgi:UDP-N-acetylmuramate dehydrogenase
MKIIENVSLKKLHTFGIDIKAHYWAEFAQVEELQNLLKEYAHVPYLLMGEGSNLLFTQDFEGIVLHNCIKGITWQEKIVDTEHHSFQVVRVGAGENWHNFVLYCLENDLYGLENLSLIYGTVGAAPMQNIGAYGREVKHFIHKVHAYHLPTGEMHIIDNETCQFGYRSSIFKTSHKGQYCITAVDFILPTQPSLHIAYGDIQRTLEEMNIAQPTPQDVSRAVIHIRQNKLPNPAEIGNAGSFFKNPEITQEEWQELVSKYPNCPSYPSQEGLVKIPAGWLIEQAGWKGYRRQDAGVHAKQALVLVNYAQATGKEIWYLAQDIQQDVLEKFGVRLIPEVNII